MKKILLFLLLPLMCLRLEAQTDSCYTITGLVAEAVSQLPVEGATVSVIGAQIKATTDNNGRFEIKIPGFPAFLWVTGFGYMEAFARVSERKVFPIHINMSETCDIDYFGRRDRRGGIRISGLEDSNMGDAKDCALGVVSLPDSIFAVGAAVCAIDKDGYEKRVAICNEYGKFLIPIDRFPTTLEIRYIGYKSKKIKVTRRNVKNSLFVTLDR